MIFKNKSTVDKSLVKTTKKKEKVKNTKIKNESGDIFTNSSERKRIVRKYCEKLYANCFRLLWQNTIDCVAYKQKETYFSQFTGWEV